MKQSSLLLIIGLVVVIAIVVVAYLVGLRSSQQTLVTPSPITTVTPQSAASATASPTAAAVSEVRITSPAANTVVTSPLTIAGQARGSWFFEAQFPAIIKDSTGKEIGRGVMKADGEWMTTDFVPFTGTITFTKPAAGGTGSLVLQKDNPSGLPQNAGEVSIPIKF